MIRDTNDHLGVDDLEDYARDRELSIRCLVCSRRFIALGNHLRQAHEMTVDQYRFAYGIPFGLSLVARKLHEDLKSHALLRIKMGTAPDWVTDPTLNATNDEKKTNAKVAFRRKHGEGFTATTRTRIKEARLKGVRVAQEKERKRVMAILRDDFWVVELLGARESCSIFGVGIALWRSLRISPRRPGYVRISQRWQPHATRSLMRRGLSAKDAGLALGGKPHSGKMWAGRRDLGNAEER